MQQESWYVQFAFLVSVKWRVC